MISVKILYNNKINQLIFSNIDIAKNLFDIFKYTEVYDLSKLKNNKCYYVEKNKTIIGDSFLKHIVNWLSTINNLDQYYFNVVNFIYDTLNITPELYDKLLFSGENLSNNEINYLNNLVDCYYEKNNNNIYSINFENIDISKYMDSVLFTMNYIYFMFVSNGLREGQSFFNALTYALPLVADAIRGDSLLDCYYDNNNLNNLMNYLHKYKRY